MPISNETVEYRKNNNLCEKCGKPNELNKKLCKKHLDQAAQRQKRNRQERENRGLCQKCGKINDNDIKKNCIACSEKYKLENHIRATKRYKIKRLNNICIYCDKINLNGKSGCNECFEKRNILNKLRYYKAIKNRICSDCKINSIHNGKRCQECIDKRNNWYKNSLTKEKEKQRRNERRYLVFNHYGNRCSCCGENEFNFLSIDHKNNKGNEHRKKINKAGSTFFKWLIDNNFPEEFQILCMNCNFGRYRNGGICPHQQEDPNLLDVNDFEI